MLNTFDEGGGAARSAVRLLRGVRERHVDARLLVQFKTGTAREILGRETCLQRKAASLKLYLGLLPVRLYPKRPENNFSPALLPDNLPARIARIDPDIVHLHWLAAGFCRIETLARINKPLLWTLHDSWAFTGGCHVPFDCTRYRLNCGSCPILGSTREKDLSRWTWARKERAWRDLNLTVVAPSRWLADCARASSLFRDVRVEVVPNGLDIDNFRPMDKESSRDLLGLPRDRKIILFGAVKGVEQENKGFHLLQPALKKLKGRGKDTLAVVFGGPPPKEKPDLGMPAVFLGHIRDDRSLAALYSGADVFVVPSLQEAFCQTAAESMACGTPVVAFGATGLLDVVEHQRCGYLAQPYAAEDLARGIDWVLEDPCRYRELSRRAREKVKTEFSLARVASRYTDLYREISGNAARGNHG